MIVPSSLQQTLDLILMENRTVLETVDPNAIAQFITAITRSKRIFVAGEGRSGLVMRMFAMRLMHLGYQDFVVGETITPSIQNGDLLIDCSGSGSTGNVLAIAQTAQTTGAQIVSITTQPDSPLGQLADITIHLRAAAKQDRSQQHSQQFAGSLFEQSTLLLLDAIFHLIAKQTHQSAETLYSLHANLE
jgi:6-phospho-3-hexuloisomerase